MFSNKFLKLITSMPVILIILYFIPFLGVCLIFLRYFMSSIRKRVYTPIVLFIIGLLILIPKFLNVISDVVSFDINSIPYLSDIINSKTYNTEMIEYSKFIICTAIVLVIISFILEKIFNKIKIGIRSYINSSIEKDAEISRENDIKMKIQQQKLKNTNYVRCPNCGSNNILSEKTGTCQFCRRTIENKKYIG